MVMSGVTLVTNSRPGTGVPFVPEDGGDAAGGEAAAKLEDELLRDSFRISAALARSVGPVIMGAGIGWNIAIDIAAIACCCAMACWVAIMVIACCVAIACCAAIIAGSMPAMVVAGFRPGMLVGISWLGEVSATSSPKPGEVIGLGEVSGASKFGAPVGISRPGVCRFGAPVGNCRPGVCRGGAPVGISRPGVCQLGTPVGISRPSVNRFGAPVGISRPGVCRFGTPVGISRPGVCRFGAPVGVTRPGVCRLGVVPEK